MHCKGDSDDTVGEEHTDVLGDGGVADQLGSCQRSNHEQGVEQDDTDDSLLVGGLLNVGAADQDSCDGVQTNVILLLNGIEGTQVLQEDQLTPGCQNSGDAGSDDTGLIDIDTGRSSDTAVLTDSTHVLTQTSVDQPVVERCKACNKSKCKGRQTDSKVNGLDSGDEAADKKTAFNAALKEVLAPANELLARVFFGEDFTFFTGSEKDAAYLPSPSSLISR